MHTPQKRQGRRNEQGDKLAGKRGGTKHAPQTNATRVCHRQARHGPTSLLAVGVRCELHADTPQSPRTQSRPLVLQTQGALPGVQGPGFPQLRAFPKKPPADTASLTVPPELSHASHGRAPRPAPPKGGPLHPSRASDRDQPALVASGGRQGGEELSFPSTGVRGHGPAPPQAPPTGAGEQASTAPTQTCFWLAPGMGAGFTTGPRRG